MRIDGFTRVYFDKYSNLSTMALLRALCPNPLYIPSMFLLLYISSATWKGRGQCARLGSTTDFSSYWNTSPTTTLQLAPMTM